MNQKLTDGDKGLTVETDRNSRTVRVGFTGRFNETSNRGVVRTRKRGDSDEDSVDT